MPKLSVIIPSYNTKTVTKQCIESLLKTLQMEDLDFEIIVIDNASTDGTVKLLTSLRINELRVIQNKKNLGFAKANNQGLETAKGG